MLKQRLAQSKFRAKFHLANSDRAYIAMRGWEEIYVQAREIISRRLGAAFPEKDGKQTPFRGHVVFIAQHATGCCCRSCLEKWHNIGKGAPLTDSQLDYIAQVIVWWLQDRAGDLSCFERNRSLFD